MYSMHILKYMYMYRNNKAGVHKYCLQEKEALGTASKFKPSRLVDRQVLFVFAGVRFLYYREV